MRLENSFEVPAPPEQAWELLLDVPRVVPIELVPAGRSNALTAPLTSTSSTRVTVFDTPTSEG